MQQLICGWAVQYLVAREDYYNGGEFMGGYHWEQIVMLLLDKIENMKVHEEEMNREINRLMEENVRLEQVLKRHGEGEK